MLDDASKIASVSARAIALVLALAGLTIWARFEIGLDLEGGSLLRVHAPEGVGVELAIERVRAAVDEAELDAQVLARADEIDIEVRGDDSGAIDDLVATLARGDTLELLPVIADERFDSIRGPDRATVERRIAELGPLPAGRRALIEEHVPYEGPPEYAALLVDREAVFGGEHVASVYLNDDPHGMGPSIGLELDPTGRDRLTAHTERHVRERVALVIDGDVLMAPMIHEPIRIGRLQISLGARSADEHDPSALVAAIERSRMPALRLTARHEIHSSAPSWLGRPMLRGLGVLGVVLAIAAVFLRRSWLLAISAAWTSAVLGACVVLVGLGGTLTLALYAGLVAPAIGAALAVSLVRPRDPWRRRALRMIPGLAWIGLAVVVSLALHHVHGPVRGTAIAGLCTAPIAVLVALVHALVIERVPSSAPA